MTNHRARGRLAVTLPEMRRGSVAACRGTLLARCKPQMRPAAGFNRRELDFASQSLAFATARGQLAYDQLLERQGHIRILRTIDDLRRHWSTWSAAPSASRSG